MIDVVVVGYGTQSQRRVTGAIASINEKDINAVAVTGLDQAMQGADIGRAGHPEFRGTGGSCFKDPRRGVAQFFDGAVIRC